MDSVGGRSLDRFVSFPIVDVMSYLFLSRLFTVSLLSLLRTGGRVQRLRYDHDRTIPVIGPALSVPYILGRILSPLFPDSSCPSSPSHPVARCTELPDESSGGKGYVTCSWHVISK